MMCLGGFRGGQNAFLKRCGSMGRYFIIRLREKFRKQEKQEKQEKPGKAGKPVTRMDTDKRRFFQFVLEPLSCHTVLLKFVIDSTRLK